MEMFDHNVAQYEGFLILSTLFVLEKSIQIYTMMNKLGTYKT